MLRTAKFIVGHPLARRRPAAALWRYFLWQIESRLKSEIEYPWINGTRLVVRNGMTGATGNIYCGLHEFADMGFVLHFLRPGDLFGDVGANIGSYTVIAAGVARSDVVAFEPDPGTAQALRRNVDANGLANRVSIIEAAVGAAEGEVNFTVGRDTTNQVASDEDEFARKVRLVSLDSILIDRTPTMLKLDVEGYEAQVFEGAKATLNHPSLRAIETETVDARIVEQLSKAGFEQVFYDPFTRRIERQPTWPQGNALFVRDREECEARTRAAPPSVVHGQVF